MPLLPISFSLHKNSIISFTLISLNINSKIINSHKILFMIEFYLIFCAMLMLNYTNALHFDAGWTPERECDGNGSLLLCQIGGCLFGFIIIKIFNFSVHRPRVWIKYAILVLLFDGIFSICSYTFLVKKFEIQLTNLTAKSWDDDAKKIITIVIPKDYPIEYREKAKAQSVMTSILMSQEHILDSIRSCHNLENYWKILNILAGIGISIAIVILI